MSLWRLDEKAVRASTTCTGYLTDAQVGLRCELTVIGIRRD